MASDHPHTDPGDGRSECQRCGKWIFPVIHSCKGVPVTEAAQLRKATTKQPEFRLGQIVELELRDCLVTAVHEGGLIDVQFGGTTIRELDPNGWDAQVRRVAGAEIR